LQVLARPHRGLALLAQPLQLRAYITDGALDDIEVEHCHRLCPPAAAKDSDQAFRLGLAVRQPALVPTAELLAQRRVRFPLATGALLDAERVMRRWLGYGAKRRGGGAPDAVR
jgi:hypothetical protein